jgi:hypothetical protein
MLWFISYLVHWSVMAMEKDVKYLKYFLQLPPGFGSLVHWSFMAMRGKKKHLKYFLQLPPCLGIVVASVARQSHGGGAAVYCMRLLGTLQ